MRHDYKVLTSNHCSHFRDILTSLIKAVGSKIPVTCKIRIFPDIDKTLSLVETIVATGVEAMAVHGRTKDERPNNDVHVDAIQVKFGSPLSG